MGLAYGGFDLRCQDRCRINVTGEFHKKLENQNETDKSCENLRLRITLTISD